MIGIRDIGINVHIFGGKISGTFLASAEIGNVADNKIVLLYSRSLDTGSVPATGDFSVGGTSETVSAVGVAGSSVTITLTGNVGSADTITITYTAGANPIRDLDENNVDNLVSQAVTNNIGGDYLLDMHGNIVYDMHGDPVPKPTPT